MKRTTEMKTPKRWFAYSIKERPRYQRRFWTRYHGTPEGHDADGRYIRGDEREVGSISTEYLYLQRRGHGFGIDFTLDTWGAKLGIYCGRLFTVWVKAGRWRPVMWAARKLLPKNEQYGFLEEREVEARVNAGLVSLRLWREPNHHRSGDRRDILWNWKAWATGRPTYSKTVLESGSAIVPMPEGQYAAVYELSETVHEWPRFKRRKVGRMGEIRVEGGIYVPGKGENSWDCGDDAIMSVYKEAATKEDLVAEYVKKVLLARLRINGHHKVPAAA